MTGPPSCPFGAPWEDLKLRDLRRFLKNDPPERATWEAKQQADKGQLAKFVRKECSAFANRNGGLFAPGCRGQQGLRLDFERDSRFRASKSSTTGSLLC